MIVQTESGVDDGRQNKADPTGMLWPNAKHVTVPWYAARGVGIAYAMKGGPLITSQRFGFNCGLASLTHVGGVSRYVDGPLEVGRSPQIGRCRGLTIWELSIVVSYR
jgi:hypothetical protein